jgi:hypothetical protein
MKTFPTNVVNGITGERQMRTLARAVDRWGREVWLEFDRWKAGKTALTAYNADGSTMWKPGKQGQEAIIYHRANIVEMEGETA